MCAAPCVRVLLLADTHLGFDLPLRPRVQRRRRGPDFFANTERALEPALRGEVDLVVHGGDVLYRSKVRAQLVQQAFEPLLRVADGGVPVVVVPGNHERSAIPYPLLVAHPRLFLLDRPDTIRLTLNGVRVALSGFPCVRNGIQGRFSELLAQTGWQDRGANVRLLCLHQTVEGARVGPAGYTFRRGPDIIRGRDIPPGFAAVLAGHIHRHQVLTADLSQRPLAAPVLYPGAIERTSSAERDEDKGVLELELAPDASTGGRLERWRFRRLPARPWRDLSVAVNGLGSDVVRSKLRKALSELEPDAVVRVRFTGSPAPGSAEAMRAAAVRDLAPETMTVELSRPREVSGTSS
ncbi:MAG: metallophosphoesterase [bacterium]